MSLKSSFLLANSQLDKTRAIARLLVEPFLILLAGNLASLFSWLWHFPVNSGFFSVALALGIYLYVGFRYRTSLLSSFRTFRPELRKTGLAVAVGIVLTLPPLIFFLFPVVVSTIDYTPIKTLSTTDFLLRVLIEVPLLTAFSEELLFRQHLFARFKTPVLVKTLLINAAIFTLWHLVVAIRTILDTNLSLNPVLIVVTYFGGLLSIFAGGIVFGLVRHYMGSFFYSAITHWLNVALMIVVIWLK